MSTAAPISTQIFSISKALIAGLLVLSAFAIGTTLLIKSTFTEYRGTAHTTLTAAAVFEDIFEARIASLKWRQSADAEHVREFRENIQELKVAEAELKAASGESAQLSETFENLEAELDQYEAQFNVMLEARTEYDRVKGEVSASGVAARQALTEIMTTAFDDNDPKGVFHASRAQEALMLGRY